jgi:hypothetical protein
MRLQIVFFFECRFVYIFVIVKLDAPTQRG